MPVVTFICGLCGSGKSWLADQMKSEGVGLAGQTEVRSGDGLPIGAAGRSEEGPRKVGQVLDNPGKPGTSPGLARSRNGIVLPRLPKGHASWTMIALEAQLVLELPRVGPLLEFRA